MMYPYITLADETEITYSHVLERYARKEVEVHFERPTEDGFDVARCVLPSYEWIKRDVSLLQNSRRPCRCVKIRQTTNERGEKPCRDTKQE